MKRTVVVTEDDFIGKDELYAKFYRCNNCGSTDLVDWYKYCPDCGYKIEWQITEKD